MEQDLARAEELYRQAVGKGYSLAMNKLALLIVARGGDLKEAEALAQAAIKRDGQPVFDDTLGRILALQGDIAGAEDAYRTAAKKSPQPRGRTDQARTIHGQRPGAPATASAVAPTTASCPKA